MKGMRLVGTCRNLRDMTSQNFPASLINHTGCIENTACIERIETVPLSLCCKVKPEGQQMLRPYCVRTCGYWCKPSWTRSQRRGPRRWWTSPPWINQFRRVPDSHRWLQSRGSPRVASCQREIFATLTRWEIGLGLGNMFNFFAATYFLVPPFHVGAHLVVGKILGHFLVHLLVFV